MSPELPRNLEAEQALLGSILVSNKAYHNVSDFLRAEHFANALHGKLYDDLARLIEKGQAVSVVTLKTYLEQDEAMKKAGGAAYLAGLMAASAHMADAATYARIVVDAAHRRRVIDLAAEAIVAARSPEAGDSATQQIERLERGLYDISRDGEEGGFLPSRHFLTQAVASAEAAHKREGHLAGLSTGLSDVDDLLGGLHRSDLVILAGRPSMGKTALATNMAFAAAQRYREELADGGVHRPVDGAKVAFFSLEMSGEQLMVRIVADRAGVPSERIRRGQLTNPEMERVIAACQELEDLPLFIDQTAALSVGALRTRARRLQRQHGIGLIVVDYLQLVGSARTDGRVQEVSEISRGLKTLAKELDVPVLALSQLSRKVEDRTDKRPQLSDLRDSGSIEQDADVVLFVFREEYYLEKTANGSAEHLASLGLAELLISKQRHGPTGTVKLRFAGAKTKFSDFSANDMAEAA